MNSVKGLVSDRISVLFLARRQECLRGTILESPCDGRILFVACLLHVSSTV